MSLATAASGHEPRDEHFHQKLLEFLLSQAGMPAIPIFVSAALIAAMAAHSGMVVRAAIWLGALSAMIVLRHAALRWLASDRSRPAWQRMYLAAVLSALNGLVHGAAAWLFFAELDLISRTVLSIVLMGWASGAVATTAGYLPSYLSYVTPVLLPLAAVWGLSAAGDSTWAQRSLGALILAYAFVQVRFAQVSQRMFRATFDYEIEIERSLERAEIANAAKARFLAAASHDLRQPIHSLALFGATLSLRAQEPEIKTLAEQMNSTIDSLGRLLDTLLDLSRLDAGVVKVDRTPVDLRPWLAAMAASCQPLAAAQGLQLVTRLPDAPLPALTDLRLLERVLRNLLDNALKYTRTGQIEIIGTAREGRVEVAVRDTGCGIPLSEQARVFDEFYQVGNPERDRRQGLGLGLAIVQRTAALLDVAVTLESAPGKGTEVRLVLPAATLPPPVPQAEPKPKPTPAAERALDILLIDDEPEVRAATTQLLELWGWQAFAAADPAEAIEIARAQRPDLVIADLRLRDHRSGIEVIARLRELCGPIPALLVTGEFSPDPLAAAHAAGLRVLHKPVPPDRLRAEIVAASQALPSPPEAQA